MTFRTDVLEVDDDDDADEPMLGVQNNGIIPLWDHGYIDICGTDHSKSKPFQKWTLKRSVLGWRSVLQVRIPSPHCSEHLISGNMSDFWYAKNH